MYACATVWGSFSLWLVCFQWCFQCFLSHKGLCEKSRFSLQSYWLNYTAVAVISQSSDCRPTFSVPCLGANHVCWRPADSGPVAHPNHAAADLPPADSPGSRPGAGSVYSGGKWQLCFPAVPCGCCRPCTATADFAAADSASAATRYVLLFAFFSVYCYLIKSWSCPHKILSDIWTLHNSDLFTRQENWGINTRRN